MRLSESPGVTDPRPLLLARLSTFVETRMGLNFPQARQCDLERGIRSAAGAFGFNDVDSCMEWLLSTPLSTGQIKTLAAHLVVGETYFFRDAKVFEILETQMLPGIINSRRGGEQNLRIWSAGCSTGEEPYSLALLLARILPDLQEWNISILATDISAESLEKASEGVYGEWSFRDTQNWVKDRYFKKIKQKYQIDSRIKRMVTFFSLNLAEDPYPAVVNATNAMDIIFCRNVLMYFSRDRANAVIHNLAHCLVDGGWLVISPVEAPGIGLSPLLQPVHFPGAILYRREERPKKGGRPISLPAPPQFKKKSMVPVRAKAAPAKRHDTIRLVAEGKKCDAEKMSDQVRLLANLGKLTDALALCGEALQADKLDPSLHYLQATILQEMGKAEEAVASLKRAIYIDQDFVIAHFALGHLLQRQGRKRESGKHLETARSLLQSHRGEDILPDAEGLSAERLIQLINTMQGRQPEVIS